MNDQMAEFARLGSATVYEAGGRIGYVDADLVHVIPGSRAPARPAPWRAGRATTSWSTRRWRPCSRAMSSC